MMNLSNNNHPFHLVTYSPWPILTSFSLMSLLYNLTNLMFNLNSMITLSLITLYLSIYQWWRDIIREATFQGMHTKLIIKSLKMSMILFIISELFLFISLFWMILHMSLSPSISIGMKWPPCNIQPFNPLDIPLLNSIILISSGITLTLTHYYILINKKYESIISLLMTLILGMLFSLIQFFEYNMASFTITDSVYGSSFFMITGFHGMHVIIGIFLLLTSLIRLINNHLSSYHHFNFTAGAWYWHFVDIIWLMVYILVYFT